MKIVRTTRACPRAGRPPAHEMRVVLVKSLKESNGGLRHGRCDYSGGESDPAVLAERFPIGEIVHMVKAFQCKVVRLSWGTSVPLQHRDMRWVLTVSSHLELKSAALYAWRSNEKRAIANAAGRPTAPVALSPEERGYLEREVRRQTGGAFHLGAVPDHPAMRRWPSQQGGGGGTGSA